MHQSLKLRTHPQPTPVGEGEGIAVEMSGVLTKFLPRLQGKYPGFVVSYRQKGP